MSRLRNIYLYLVSFVTLIMVLMGTIFTVQSLTDVIFPTNNNYYVAPADKTSGLSVEDRKIQEQNQKIDQQNRETESKKGVVKSMAVVLVALPTFMYHWRKIEKEKSLNKGNINEQNN